MHALSSHSRIFETVPKCGIFQPTRHGKYNDDIASKDYFRSSILRGIAALDQLFLKKQRIQFLQASGCERVNNSVACSNCEDGGHTIKTCTNKCNFCNYNASCGHLQKVNRKWVQKCKLWRIPMIDITSLNTIFWTNFSSSRLYFWRFKIV